MVNLTKRIIYPADIGVAVIVPCDCGLTVEEIAAKDVPAGKEYKIINASDLPTDRSTRNDWKYEDFK